MQKAICLAYKSRFGCGGALFHNPDYEGYVDTVTYGCWRKSTLERLGYFDEAFVRNQDDELNYSHAIARRLPAETLYDTICRATGSMSRLW